MYTYADEPADVKHKKGELAISIQFLIFKESLNRFKFKTQV